MNKTKVLLVEDNPGDARLIREMLAEEKTTRFDLKCVDRLSSGLEHLEKGNIDAILLDLGLPDSQGLDTFTKLYDRAQGLPIIMMTGLDDEELAVKAVGMGAQDYLVKGQLDNRLLVRTIRYSIERKRMEETIKNSELKFKHIYDSSLDALYTSSIDGKILDINSAGVSMLGYESQDELKKVNAKSTYVEPNDRKKFIQLMSKGPLKHFETKLKRKDGTIIDVIISTIRSDSALRCC